MSEETKYWRSWQERDGEETFLRELQAEFPEPPLEARGNWSRRGFLKAAGFAFAGAALTGCNRIPAEKAIPLLVQPEVLTPGRATYYASTCAACPAACGLLVKNRDGRPIKLEGNPQHPLSRGGLCAIGQASILGLYDSLRLDQPAIEGRKVSWPELDAAVTARLQEAKTRGGMVCFLSSTIPSPTKRDVIRRFLGGFSQSRHVVYDPLSSSAILDAHQRTHRVRALPRYRFERARVIVGLDADFLGTWISPVEYTAGYSTTRDPDWPTRRISYHAQFESRLSVTGSKADARYPLAPGEIGPVLNYLAAQLAQKAGSKLPWEAPADPPSLERPLDELASRLWENRGGSLVVCGVQDVPTQILCNYLNHILDNYGNTLDLEDASFQRQGNDRDWEQFVQELREGKVFAVLVDGVDPLSELPDGESLADLLRRVPLRVSFQDHLDETSLLAPYVCPDHHFLESWSDAEPVNGMVSLTQPAIAPLGNRRSVIETLAVWSGAPRSAREIVRGYWQENIFPRQNQEPSFEAFWDRTLHDGCAVVKSSGSASKGFDLATVLPVQPSPEPSAESFALVLYPKVGILDGRYAGNPWLQELPDPISKVTWDNYACLSPAAADRLGVTDGDVVLLRANFPNGKSGELELPALLQPGQHDRVVAVALGYGRRSTERFANIGPPWIERRPTVGENGRIGKNSSPLLALQEGTLRYTGVAATLTKTGRKHRLASTQNHHSLAVPKHLAWGHTEARPIVQETTSAELLQNPHAGSDGHSPAGEDLWPRDHTFPGHRWAMVIDLTRCTGCSACVIACQAENNVPVVGKDEVERKRAMHWLRIDRYYSEREGSVAVAHQPMLCQHCEHAPCETVCPVLATVHSEEGLNEQIYNRCVGTRYCANNCPYKTRRFNWFDYPREDRLANLALNPDVTVRSRGVMEKCTFCVQRIQDGKAEAKRSGEPLRDGDIRTACEQSCPAQAIVFGDINDPKSWVSQLARSGRYYRVLEEINVRPSVGYLRLVRNRPAEMGGNHRG